MSKLAPVINRSSNVPLWFLVFLTLAVAANARGEPPALPEAEDLPHRSLNEIIDRAAESLGGRGTLGAIDSVSIRQTLRRDAGESISIVILKKRPRLIRVTLTHEHFIQTQAFDGTRGWVRQQAAGVDRSRYISAEEAERIIREHTLVPVYIEPATVGARLEAGGRVRFAGYSCYVIHAHFSNGDHHEYLIDGREFVERRVVRSIRRGDNVHRVEIVPREPEFVDGVLFPRRLIYFIDGKRDAVAHLEHIEINPGLLAETFALPELVPPPRDEPAAQEDPP
ncbi:MAG: hypothetical protein JJT96_20575 [Opitutales bacterium]|nr:hypothetical protein [Opitutales bacterium]